MAKLLKEFEHYPEEGHLIGRLLAAYGELEFALMSCVSLALGQNTSTACRILFRVKGETARIEVADAILRPFFVQFNLDGHWGSALGALRHCKKIRNQFAHCHWYADEHGLFFMDLDSDAQSSSQALKPELLNVDIGLLQKQENYFVYALDWVFYLMVEAQKRQGTWTEPNRPYLIPQIDGLPPLHNPPDTHLRGHKKKDDGKT
jgi:hypothetical protein